MANKKRLIDANAFIQHFEECKRKVAILPLYLREILSELYSEVIEEINKQPTVDAVEVVHGRWIPIIDEPTPLRKMPMLSGYKCSVCGRYEEKEEPYCNCGARMDGDGNNV